VTAFRSGFVGLAGRPNVGKSTLVNALCGSHVAIVSDKPQTTRRRILGVAHEPGAQLILADLPGFQRPRDALTQRMQRAVDESLRDVDAALFVIDATEEIGAGDRFVAGRVYAGELPVVVALNKVDRLRPPQIATAIERAAALGPFHALHPISARTGDGVEALRRELVELLPEGPPYFDEAQDSDQPVALRIAELVREQALHLTRQEVPHAVAVTVEELDRPKGRRPGRVVASLLVETESQQRILVGKHGSVVRAIGEGSRPEIESLLGGQIFLDLRVKVRPRWRRDDALLDRYDL
jgi:GTP-binding protein Era